MSSLIQISVRAVVLAAALAATNSALAQCVTCPPGSQIENEPQCAPPDIVNGGCNYLPYAFGAVTPGQTICGTAFIVQTPEGPVRDTDWYEFTLATESAVSITGLADFNYQVGFAQSPCPVFQLYIASLGNSCSPVPLSTVLPAGTWYLFVAPQLGPVLPCGTKYQVRLGVDPVGSCCLASGVCQLSSAQACAAAGGVFRGVGSPCGNCPQLQGQWGEQTDAGDLVGSAQVTMGTGALTKISGIIDPDDSDMYAIQICSPAGFSAQTVTGPGTLGDSQLFLFMPDGTGITFNDDDPQGGNTLSRLGSTFTSALPAGVYYLAISTYDVDPEDSAALDLWADQPYTTERAPDGPGAANPIAAWYSTGTGGTYTITLTGACFAAPAGWTEEAEAGDLLTGAQLILGNGPLNAVSGLIAADSDADVYGVRLCNPAAFSAETVTGPGTLGDTQLFLFRPTGVGIAFNDDDPQGLGAVVRSRLSSTFTSALPVGQYYLGVSGYDRDPVNSGSQALWLDTPFATERAPDGPGAASPVAGWMATANTGSYVVRLSGACYTTVVCYANCDESIGSPLLTGNDFICFINAYASSNPYANCDQSTGQPTLTANDFICFINAYAAGCPQ